MQNSKSTTYQNPSIVRRAAAFLIDLFLVTFLIVAVTFTSMGSGFIDDFNPNRMMMSMGIVMIIGFVLFFAKDSLQGVSPGKWIMGIMVRDKNNPDEIPSFKRLFVRNLLLIIWPVEFIVLATSQQNQRYGDKTVDSIVVKNPNKSSKVLRGLALIGFGVCFIGFVFFTATNAMKSSTAYQLALNEIERNEEILAETGGIEGFGKYPKGNVSTSGNQGQAQFEIKVLGNQKDLDVFVYLIKEAEGEWKLIEIRK